MCPRLVLVLSFRKITYTLAHVPYQYPCFLEEDETKDTPMFLH